VTAVFTLPAAIADQGDKAAERFFTFFTDTIPNNHTRAAYYRNTMRFFAWTHAKRLSLPASGIECSFAEMGKNGNPTGW